MKFLGFDYGRRHLGVALAVKGIVTPLTIIHYRRREEAILAIKQLVAQKQPEGLVWGLARGRIARESYRFAEKVAEVLKLPVYFVDETLTSRDARAIQSYNRRHRQREDDVAAALILEYFLSERR